MITVRENPSKGVNAEAVGLQDLSGLGWIGQGIERVRSMYWMDRFRERWGRFLGLQRKDGYQASQHLHAEAAFRFLTTNEVERSERSGRPVYILLIYMSGSRTEFAPVESEILSPLLSVISGVLRETDYIGWYCDGYVLGGVLTAWGESPSEQSVSQIEQRFWRRMKHQFPMKDFTGLGVRLFEIRELSSFESERPSYECDDGG